jgi:hypothetical protein
LQALFHRLYLKTISFNALLTEEILARYRVEIDNVNGDCCISLSSTAWDIWMNMVPVFTGQDIPWIDRKKEKFDVGRIRARGGVFQAVFKRL